MAATECGLGAFVVHEICGLETSDSILGKSGLPGQTESVVGVIREAIKKGVETPGIDHKREDLTDEDVRFGTVYKHYMMYRPDTKPLEVIAVVSGWRNVQTELTIREEDCLNNGDCPE